MLTNLKTTAAFLVRTHQSLIQMAGPPARNVVVKLFGPENRVVDVQLPVSLTGVFDRHFPGAALTISPNHLSHPR